MSGAPHGHKADPRSRIANAFTPAAGDWGAVAVSALQDVAAPPRQWCVPDMVPDKCVTLLSGDGGTGKSLLAMQLASCCALGLPFMGIELARRKVLYLAAEDDFDELHRRQEDINQGLGVDMGDYENQLYFKTLSADRALLATVDPKGRSLVETASYTNLKAFCVSHGIQLLIVDTAADTFGGLEIDRQHVTRYVRMLEAIARETGGAVILIAHPGVSGMASGTGISGSTAWRNAVRSVIYMRRPTKEEADGPEARDLRIVERLKGNFAAAGSQLRVAWFEGHFVLSDTAESAAQAIDGIAAEAKVLSAMRRAAAQGRRMTFAKSSTDYAPKKLMAYREVSGLRLQHVERAVASMLERGELREAHVGPPSKGRVWIVPAEHPPLDGERGPPAPA